MRPIRILVVTNMYPSPGAPASGVFVEQQINGLLAIGLDVKVVIVDRRLDGPLAYYRMAPAIRVAIDEFHPDLVHAMYGGVMANQITSYRKMAPVIVTFHGSDLLGENLSGLVRKFISRYGVCCSRRAAQKARGVIVVARHLIDALPSRFNHQKLRVIPCGIDLDRFKPMDPVECRKRLGWQEDAFHVLFASANNDPVKRPWLARAAVDRTASQGIPAKINWLTGVPNTDVPVWLNASHVLLLTSLHEGSPTVVKESLACGVPVVSLDVGDVAERIAGVDGCYLAHPDAADLAEKLQLVYRRKEPIRRNAAVNGLSHLSVAKQLNQFYEEILGRPPPPGADD